MCNTDEAASQQLPLRILLILAVCACSLLVHFFAEGLAPVGIKSGVDLAAQSEPTQLCEAQGEDNFIIPFPVRFPVYHPVEALQTAMAAIASATSISPLLPPPNS